MSSDTLSQNDIDRLLGGAAEFSGADTSTKLKLLGVDVASFGDAHATTPGALEVTVHNPVQRSYAKLVVSDGKVFWPRAAKDSRDRVELGRTPPL